MKPSRAYILSKLNGRCAYCGIELNGKFQVDHLEPQKPWKKHPEGFDVNHPNNLYAACASCNNYKSSYPLEFWRKMLTELVTVQLKRNSQYKIALQYWLVTETIKPVVFYFETLNASKGKI
jgi:hypothetical protein